MPTVKFALTVKDGVKPSPPTALIYNPLTKMVMFTSSTSKDVSFYNVYNAQPAQGTVPLLQLRGKNSFDATPYTGQTLFVTAVDQAGNEGDATTITIPNPAPTPATT